MADGMAGLTDGLTNGRPLTGVEATKAGSRALRGDIAAEISAAEAGGGVSEATYNLLKFHGTYEQFDRDTATARKQRGEDKDWSFMVRVRCPAGRLTPAQYLVLDHLAEERADAEMQVTTRQGVQFHRVARGNLRGAIGDINAALMTTFAACGDVVRNVVTTAAPRQDALHARLVAEARRLSDALLPRSRSHHQIFVEGADPVEAEPEEEPVYGATYLPRKFKIALCHPSDNTPDVLSNDLGFIAETAGDGVTVTGWVVTVGGGMGMTHAKATTYPRLADAVTRIGPDEVLEMAVAVVKLHRDWGDRADRKHARLKYVVAEMGLDRVRERLSETMGRALEPATLPRLEMPELLGWHAQGDGRLWLGLPLAAGRIADHGETRTRTALREAVARFNLSPVATAQQDILLADVDPADRPALEALLRAHNVTFAEDLTALSRWALACVALPTCGQALTEGERARAPIVADVEAVLARHGVLGERVSLRVTGCANGCARPYAGDIGVVGRAPGLYALFVGGDFEGTRLSFQVADKVPQASVGAVLEPLVAAWAAGRTPGEGFGPFCTRLGAEAARALAGPVRKAA